MWKQSPKIPLPPNNITYYNWSDGSIKGIMYNNKSTIKDSSNNYNVIILSFHLFFFNFLILYTYHLNDENEWRVGKNNVLSRNRLLN